jgi:hypothetical protein
VHAIGVIFGIDAYASLKNSLMNGYSKGGPLEEAKSVFCGVGNHARSHICLELHDCFIWATRAWSEGYGAVPGTGKAGFNCGCLHSGQCAVSVQLFTAAQDFHAGV